MASPVQTDDQSLDSVVQSLLNETSITELSPYLTAIQSIKGDKPGEKYKELNKIARKIIERGQDIDRALALLDASQDIPLSFKPFIRVLIATHFRSDEIVLEALKSDDVKIVNQALKADHFFGSSNSITNAEFYAANIFPCISVRTRFKIIKILSRSLIGAETNAEKFYKLIEDLFGTKEAYPLLFICSEDFIFGEIIKRKLSFKTEELLKLYKLYPNLVIRFLNLGNEENANNAEERKIHSINLKDYLQFLPHLIRHHVQDFLNFVRVIDSNPRTSVGSTRKSLLLKNAVDDIISNPAYFLKIYTLKDLCKRLTLEQFENMFLNLLPEKVGNFDLNTMIYYLKYYPKKQRLDLLKRQFKSKYSVDLMDNLGQLSDWHIESACTTISEEFFEALFEKFLPLSVRDVNVNSMIAVLNHYPEEKRLNLILETFKKKYKENLLDNIQLTKSEKLLKLLPLEERTKQAQKFINLCKEKDKEFYKWHTFLPLEQSFPVLKKVISETSAHSLRIVYIKYLFDCCMISKSQKDLLEAVQYYNTRHKNERIEVLTDVVGHISRNFDAEIFDREIWDVLKEILQRTHTKGDLSKIPSSTLNPLIRGATRFGLSLLSCEDRETAEYAERFLDVFFEMISDYILTLCEDVDLHDIYKAEDQKYSIDRIIRTISKKNPKQYSDWAKRPGVKDLHLSICILNSFDHYKEDTIEELKKKTVPAESLESFKISDYPWVMELLKDALEIRGYFKKQSFEKFKRLNRLLKKLDLETFNLLVKSEKIVYVNIKSGKPWLTLKKDKQDVIDKFDDYFDDCKNRLKSNSQYGATAARRFLLCVKWHNDLPMKFIERALREIKESGSVRILGILLDGEAFGKIADTLAPKEDSIDLSRTEAKDFYAVVKTIPPAMILTNPPISFDIIALYCRGDYIQIAIQAFNAISRKVSKTRIIKFAENLVNKPISAKKQGIKLLFRIATTNELKVVIEKTMQSKFQLSLRELIAKEVIKRFSMKPNEENWELVDICISSLYSPKEEVLIEILGKQSQFMHDAFPSCTRYAFKYMTKFLDKIEKLSTEEGAPENFKEKILLKFFDYVNPSLVKNLPEAFIFEVLDKYYFGAETEAIFLAGKNFGSAVSRLPFGWQNEQNK